jgi:hypothetical protein
MINMDEVVADTQTLFANLNDVQLGGLIREYVEENIHQGTIWEGYSKAEMGAVYKMLNDVVLYHINRVIDEHRPSGAA